MPLTSALATVLLVATSTPAGLDLPAFEAELQRVWRSAAIIQVGDQPRWAGPEGATVWLRFADELGPRAHASALGWTPFTDGVAGRVITVSPARIKRTLASAPGRAPMTNADVITRAAARVAAHELGHVLLGLEGHTRTGLMREGFDWRDLTSPRPVRLSLPSGTAARLRSPEALAANSGGRPSSAEIQ